MNTPVSPASPAAYPTGFLGLSPVVAGTACCVVSAVGYAAAQICLRYLSRMHVDPLWVVFNKELVTVVGVGLWLLHRAWLGRFVRPSRRVLSTLIIMGLAVQLIGNPCQQWAFGVVGLAITIPVTFGVSLTGSALLGFLFLNERISGRSVLAITLLLAAIALLAMRAGAAAGGAAIAPDSGLSGRLLVLGIAAPCMAGVVFALLTITIRHSVTGSTPVSVVVFITTSMGVITLGPISAYRLGVAHLLATPPEQIALMLAAGVLNLIAYLALTKGLQLTTVVHANVLNASQVAFAAVAGMLIFQEPATPWLIAGVALTIVGLLLINGRRAADRRVDQPI